MRTRGVVLSLLVTPFLLSPVPVQADNVRVGVDGVATAHDAGHPTSSDPGRTLTGATISTDTVRSEWSATATLAGQVPAGSSLRVDWTLGRQHPHGCEPLVTVAEPAAVVGPDNTVSVEQHGYPFDDLDGDFSCMTAVLTVDGVLTDRLVGPVSERNRIAGAQAAPAAPLLVAAGRRTPVLLMVTAHVRATTKVVVSGAGPGVRMKDVAVGPVSAEQTRPVVARLAAPGIADSELALTARDDVGSDSFDQPYAFRARRIEAQRPLPGRYESKDGSVRFQVTEENRVVRLRTSAVLCEGSGVNRATYPVELRMPRSGATAKVTQLSSRWFGAQLMTVRSGRVRGTFAFSTPTCSMSQVFVATRQR